MTHSSAFVGGRISGRPPFRSTWRGLAVLWALLALVGLVSLPVPAAEAKTATVTDARNGPASADIVKARYVNGERAARVSIRIRRLSKTGRFTAIVGPPGSDVFYLVKITRHADGKVAKTFSSALEDRRESRDCAMAARWNLRTDKVTVTIPQSCLNFGRFMTSYWFDARFRHAGHRDLANGKVVGRGDTPGCVTRAEFKSVHHGERKNRVREHLDTVGTPAGGFAGGLTRAYRSCSGGPGYGISYDGLTGRVVEKVKVHA